MERHCRELVVRMWASVQIISVQELEESWVFCLWYMEKYKKQSSRIVVKDAGGHGASFRALSWKYRGTWALLAQTWLRSQLKLPYKSLKRLTRPSTPPRHAERSAQFHGCSLFVSRPGAPGDGQVHTPYPLPSPTPPKTLGLPTGLRFNFGKNP